MTANPPDAPDTETRASEMEQMLSEIAGACNMLAKSEGGTYGGMWDEYSLFLRSVIQYLRGSALVLSTAIRERDEAWRKERIPPSDSGEQKE